MPQPSTQSLTQPSMVAPLRRVLVCSPQTAGWGDGASNWRQLGFHRPPGLQTAQKQHQILCNELSAAGAELLHLLPSRALTLDAAYTHDASLATEYGIILMNPGKANRQAEPGAHRALYETEGIPVLGEVCAPGTTEAGDIVWLDSRTLLVGNGYRTNPAGIGQLRELLEPYGVSVISAPLPYGAGPSECLHLMSLISLLDEKTAIVDLPWLAVETVELVRERGFRLIEIEYSERSTLACNVLALGEGRLLCIAENAKTNQKLRDAGFDVREFPGSELCVNGSGGPTCLTRPIVRS